MSQIHPKEIKLKELIENSQFIFVARYLGSEEKEAIFNKYGHKETKFIRTIYKYEILEELLPKSKTKLIDNRIGVIGAHEDEYQMEGKSFYVIQYNSRDKNARSSKEKIIFVRYNNDKNLFVFVASGAYEGKSEKKRIVKIIKRLQKEDSGLTTNPEYIITNINSKYYVDKIYNLKEIELPNEWYDPAAFETGKEPVSSREKNRLAKHYEKLKVGILENISKEHKDDNLIKHIRQYSGQVEKCDWCDKEIPKASITVGSLKDKEYLILNSLEIHKIKEDSESFTEQQFKILKRIFSE